MKEKLSKGLLSLIFWFIIFIVGSHLMSVLVFKHFINLSNYHFVLILSVIVSYLLLFISYHFIIKKPIMNKSIFKLKDVGLGAVIGLIIYFLSLGINFLLGHFFKMTTPDNLAYLNSLNPIVMIISGGIIVPILEEVFYRGFMYKLLDVYYDRVFIVFSSLLFTIIHYQNSRQIGVLIYSLLAAFVSSLILNTAYRKTNSIYTSISSHILYNLIVLITPLIFK